MADAKTSINGLWKYFIVVFLVPMLAVATSWGVITERLSNTDQKAEDNKKEIKEMRKEIQEIDKNVNKIYILQKIDLESRGVIIPDELE